MVEGVDIITDLHKEQLERHFAGRSVEALDCDWMLIQRKYLKHCLTSCLCTKTTVACQAGISKLVEGVCDVGSESQWAQELLIQVRQAGALVKLPGLSCDPSNSPMNLLDRAVQAAVDG